MFPSYCLPWLLKQSSIAKGTKGLSRWAYRSLFGLLLVSEMWLCHTDRFIHICQNGHHRGHAAQCSSAPFWLGHLLLAKCTGGHLPQQCTTPGGSPASPASDNSRPIRRGRLGNTQGIVWCKPNYSVLTYFYLDLSILCL